MKSYLPLLASVLLVTCSVSEADVPGGPLQNTEIPFRLDPSGTVAFVGVNVVPMDEERVWEDQTVVVEDGWITALGPEADVPVPDGALRVEGQGRYLMPGLADMHVHLIDQRDLFLFIANGVTTIRIMWGFEEGLDWREQVAHGEVLGPTLYAASPGLDGPPGFWPGTLVIRNGEEARTAVATQKAAGYDFIKVYSSLSVAAYDAILAEATAQDIRVVGHRPNSVPLQHLIEAGQASVAHVAGFRDALTRTPALAEAMRDADVWSGPTITVQMRSFDQAAAWQESGVWRYLSPSLRAWMEDPKAQPIGAAPASFHQQRNRAVRLLRDAGAGLLLGTDTGIRVVLPGYAIHEELQHLTEAGLTPFEALRAGTSDAARFLGTLDTSGTVARGKQADLLLLSANPLEDVRHVMEREGVMAHGQWLPEPTLQKMLDALAASYE